MSELRVGYTGWFNWPVIYCQIKEVQGDTLIVETTEGQIGQIKASEFTPRYLHSAGQEKNYGE